MKALMDRLPRSFGFHVFNCGVLIAALLLVAGPIQSHFTERAEIIADMREQLSRLTTIRQTEQSLINKAAHSGDPFLAGGEDRVISADLQANLKTMAANAGVKFLGIRGLPAARHLQLRMIAVALEVEGPVQGVERVIRSIEDQTRYLFVTSAVLRRSPDAEEVIRAELKVQGAVRDGTSGSITPTEPDSE